MIFSTNECLLITLTYSHSNFITKFRDLVPLLLLSWLTDFRSTIENIARLQNFNCKHGRPKILKHE